MRRKKHSGFTLIELILVMVIVSIIIYAGINYVQQRTQALRVDRTSAQMQQILNAGLAYFVAKGTWPNTMNDLVAGGYLPMNLNNPWGNPYNIKPGNKVSNALPNLYVYTRIPQKAGSASGFASATANAIAGILPFGYATSDNANPPFNVTACAAAASFCNVVAMVNIPGQNLNDATAVNFAGLYHHGGCVPVPQCPADITGIVMTPDVIVVPVSVSGTTYTGTSDVYPISSFTAYATQPPAANPPPCTHGTQTACQAINPATNATFWRVCLQVVTELGEVAITNVGGATSNVFPYSPWGGNVTLLAFTRCKITNESAGSPFSVYTQ